jgi:SAM-dependent methyltransferase
MDSSEWDRRYRGSDLVWTADANQFVVEVCSPLPPGRALDLAAGEGRNSVWLARRGWTVSAVDFSRIALDKGRALAEAAGNDVADRVEWIAADLAAYQPDPRRYQLVVLAYLQVGAPLRHAVLAAAADALDRDGQLLVVAHDRTNPEVGSGGPQDPDVLYGPEDVAADLTESGLRVMRAEQVRRAVDGQRDAIDLLVVATRSAPAAVDQLRP